MATAGDFISAAYLRSSANDPGRLALDPELLGHLDRVYQRAWALFGRARPEEASTTTTLSLSGSPPSAALPANFVDILSLMNEDGETVNDIPLRERNRLWHASPCVYRRGMTLYSRAEAGDPLAGDDLAMQYVDSPTALTTISVAIDPRFPVRHHQFVIDLLAVYLSVKDAGRDANEHKKLLGDLQLSASAFQAEYKLPPSDMAALHGPADRTEA